MSTPMSTSTPISFGVLFWPSHQLLDVAGPIDYLNSHTKPYLTAVQHPLADKAPTIQWHFISPTPDLTPLAATSGPLQIPTCTYADTPKLDYLLIPGPDPAAPLPQGLAEFLEKKFKEVTAVLIICTGSLAIARTGLLDGLRVCTNKWDLRNHIQAGTLRKEVKWLGNERWAVDEKKDNGRYTLWSAAGITAGIDLAAEFARRHIDKEIVDLLKDLAEFDPSPAMPDPFARILEGMEL